MLSHVTRTGAGRGQIQGMGGMWTNGGNNALGGDTLGNAPSMPGQMNTNLVGHPQTQGNVRGANGSMVRASLNPKNRKL